MPTVIIPPRLRPAIIAFLLAVGVAAGGTAAVAAFHAPPPSQPMSATYFHD